MSIAAALAAAPGRARPGEGAPQQSRESGIGDGRAGISDPAAGVSMATAQHAPEPRGNAILVSQYPV